MRATLPLIRNSDFPAIKRKRLETLQVNLGYKCNQSCVHCHVNAGPTRTEMMTREIINDVLAFMQASHVGKLDITGGAPELNPLFRELVRAARDLDVHVMDRCNLTILEQPGQEDLAQFLVEQRVEVIASMPCYLEENVDRQRGKGVFDASIRTLQLLNRLGYGQAGSGHELSLVSTRKDRCCRRHSISSKPIIARISERATASSSITCLCSPTCRSNASAAC